MTGTYDWNPMPHKVDICCPSCQKLAHFEFCEVVRICLKKDVSFFKDSKLFEYKLFQDSCGHKLHGAIYCVGLHGNSVSAISHLPDGYSPEDWDHSKYLYRGHGQDIGTVQCTECGLRAKHILDWEHEAYFSITFKGKHLWAFNRESAKDLKLYINSKDRKVENYRWRSFLLHIPTAFKKQRAREAIVKKLSKLLSD